MQADERRKLARTGTKAARGWLTAKADLFDAGFADFGEVSKAVKTYYERRVKEIYSEYQQAVRRVRLAEAVGLSLK
jgi:outer membrane protein TolC